MPRVAVSGVPAGVVSCHADQGEVGREPLPGNGSGIVEWELDGVSFVRVEVRRGDGCMAALSNPIFLT